MHFTAPCAVYYMSACFLIFQRLLQVIGDFGKPGLSFPFPAVLSPEYNDYHDCYHNYQNCQPYKIAYSQKCRAEVAEAALVGSTGAGCLSVGYGVGGELVGADGNRVGSAVRVCQERCLAFMGADDIELPAGCL